MPEALGGREGGGSKTITGTPAHLGPAFFDAAAISDFLLSFISFVYILKTEMLFVPLLLLSVYRQL